MCFAPQRRALFRHLNFQKWSDPGVFCIALYILTSKCSLRHNGVQFFISHLARWHRTQCFSEPTFRPSGATNHSKNTMFRDFRTFSLFFLLTLSLLWSALFYSSLLSASSHICFSSVHIVGSLTSKLPSIIIHIYIIYIYIYIQIYIYIDAFFLRYALIHIVSYTYNII